MINILDYIDYRGYLEDYYNAMKKQNPNYSFQLLANKAGFKNKGFAYNVVKGKKVLSKSNVFKLSKALEHDKQEALYFENLVAFCQAGNLEEKNQLFERLCQIKKRGKGASSAQLIRKEQYDYFSNSYHTVVRSLIDMYEFRGDYNWLSKMVKPSITAKQARQSVKLLERLGLINKKNGIYKSREKNLTTGKEVFDLGVRNYHIENAKLAEKAIQEISLKNRNITGLCLGISDETYKNICKEIQIFQKKIIEMAENDQQANRVYQLNFQLFPTSECEKDEK